MTIFEVRRASHGSVVRDRGSGRVSVRSAEDVVYERLVESLDGGSVLANLQSGASRFIVSMMSATEENGVQECVLHFLLTGDFPGNWESHAVPKWLRLHWCGPDDAQVVSVHITRHLPLIEEFVFPAIQRADAIDGQLSIFAIIRGADLRGLALNAAALFEAPYTQREALRANVWQVCLLFSFSTFPSHRDWGPLLPTVAGVTEGETEAFIESALRALRASQRGGR